jgi:chromate transporter
VAAFAIFLPSFILMLSILPVLDRVRRLAWVKAAMKGITPAVVGAIGVTIIQLLPHAAPDLFTGVLLALTVIALLAWRLPVLSVAVCGGLIGIVARSRLVQRLVS